MQDFPKEGANSPGEGAPTYDFAKISQKLHETERIWTPGARGTHVSLDPPHIYPEIGDAKFKCVLWTFKQQLAFKMRAHCWISFVLWTSLYCGFRDIWRLESEQFLVSVQMQKFHSHFEAWQGLCSITSISWFSLIVDWDGKWVILSWTRIAWLDNKLWNAASIAWRKLITVPPIRGSNLLLNGHFKKSLPFIELLCGYLLVLVR